MSDRGALIVRPAVVTAGARKAVGKKMPQSRYLRRRSINQAKSLSDVGCQGMVVALAVELAGACQLKPGLEVLGHGALQPGALGMARGGRLCNHSHGGTAPRACATVASVNQASAKTFSNPAKRYGLPLS